MKCVRVVAAGFFLACSPAQPRPTAAPAASIPEVGSPSTREAPEAPSATRLAPQADEAPTTCMVWRPCTCESGCVLFDQPRSAIKEGAAGKLLSGDMAGTPAMVVSAPSTTGGQTFVLEPGVPGEPRACSLARSPLLAYGCSVEKGNKPVDPELCAHGCDE